VKYTILFALLTTAACTAHGPDRRSEAPVPDTYEATVQQAVKMEPPASRPKLQSLFDYSLRIFGHSATPGEVRKMAAEIKNVKGYFHMESGNVNLSTYRVGWFLKTSDGVVVLTNLFTKKRSLTQQPVAPQAWARLVDRLREVSPNAVEGCRSDLRVDDGSADFVDFDVDGKTHRFAVYGFLPEAAFPAMEPCSGLLREVYFILSPVFRR